MSYTVKPRDISPLLQKFREFLLGRKHTKALRFQEALAARTQPPPNLPEGPAHKLAENYYYARDGRREVKPPEVLADVSPAISAGSAQAIVSGSSAAEGLRKAPTPGKMWQWD